MTKAVELLRKDFYRKGVCVIADIVKTRQVKTNNKRGIGNRQSHKIGAVVRNRLNDKKYPCYTLLASRYCKHGLVIKEDN